MGPAKDLFYTQLHNQGVVHFTPHPWDHVLPYVLGVDVNVPLVYDLIQVIHCGRIGPYGPLHPFWMRGIS